MKCVVGANVGSGLSAAFLSHFILQARFYPFFVLRDNKRKNHFCSCLCRFLLWTTSDKEKFIVRICSYCAHKRGDMICAIGPEKTKKKILVRGSGSDTCGVSDIGHVKAKKNLRQALNHQPATT